MEQKKIKSWIDEGKNGIGIGLGKKWKDKMLTVEGIIEKLAYVELLIKEGRISVMTQVKDEFQEKHETALR